MKRFLYTTILFCLITLGLSAQITIEECYELARGNYPLVRRYALIDLSEGYDLKNASRAWLPQLSLSGSATYQSDVTSIPITIPDAIAGMFPDLTIPQMSKDQYQIAAEVAQTVWDGGAVRSARDNITAGAEVERARNAVDEYALRERINGLYFGILLLDEQIRINEIFLSDLEVNYDRVRVYERNGVANQSDLDAVRVEQVTAGQNRTELLTARSAYLAMLSAFTGLNLDEGTRLVKPEIGAAEPGHPEVNRRPELDLFEAMTRQAEARRRAVTASNMPRIGVFVQGGYGKPGLNMFSNKFSTFAIGGVKLSWNIGSLYTRRTDLRKVDNALGGIDVQRDAFLFNSRLEETRLDAERRKYHEILEADDEIIALRRSILRSSEAKLENGIISVTDLVRDMNAERGSRINRAVHEIEMIRTIYEIKNLTNN